MNWTDIVGHVETMQMLRHMDSNMRVPHAISLVGPSGIGKFMVASALGTTLLCQDPQSRPCGVCQSCLQMLHHTHPDFSVVHPDGMSIKIEQIRNLQHEAVLSPYISARRVCIIDDAELMTTSAANSLLKILEDPAGEMVFILVSGNQEMLLSTIISRCMMIPCKPLQESVLMQALIHRGFAPNLSAVAARLSQGRMGVALAMLAPDGFAIRDQASNILHSLLEGTMDILWEKVALLEKMERKHLIELFGHLSYILRDTLMIATGQEIQCIFNLDLEEMLFELSTRWTEEHLLTALKVVEKARRALTGNANARLTSEALLIKIYDLTKEV